MAGRPQLDIGTHGEITVQPEGDKFMATARFRDSDGVTRQVRARADTEAKAKAALRTKLRDRKKRCGADDMTNESTLRELCEAWLDTLEPRRRSVTGTRKNSLTDETVEKYTDLIQRLIIPSVGSLRLREWTTQRAQRYLNSVETQKRLIRSLLTQITSYGVRIGALETNVMRDTERVATRDADKRVLTPADVDELIRRARAWTLRQPGQGGPTRGVDMVELVTLLMATGARIGEVLALRWSDVENLDDASAPCRVIICGTVNGKGQRVKWTKSESGHRRVTLPEFGRAALQKQRERGLPFDLIFPTRNGTPRWRNNVNRSWREIRGDDYAWCIPRTFRKTVATATERVLGADDAARQLGHSSSSVTKKFYIDRALDAPSTVSEALDGFAPTDRPNLRVVGD